LTFVNSVYAFGGIKGIP